MSMSDAYTRCEELGIDTTTPDALGRLWEALSPPERAEVFPFARNYGSPTLHPPIGAGPGGYVRTEPAAGQWRMWNGTATLVFRVVSPISIGTGRVWKIRYTSGDEASTSRRELREASHEVMAPADGTAQGAPLPIRGRLTFPPTQDAARARVLASEHIRRARVASQAHTPRLRVLDTAATTLARLAAVYLTADSERNHREARAYALAFQLVEASARRLAHRRIR